MITNLDITNVDISGRLGNNLFQIAVLIGLKEKYGYDYIVPNSWKYKNDFKNIKYGLEKLENKPYLYNETTFSYNEINFGYSNDLISLRGFFQSEKYFEHCKDDVRTSFSFNLDVIDICFNFLRNMSIFSNETCIIHIRRGDYLQKQDYHTNLLERTNYYLDAMKLMNKDGIKNYLVISDDIKFCFEKFGKLKNFYFSPFKDEIYDLCLMSLCQNYIIANSSFSWWGAYLSIAKNKRVIAPKHWFETDIDTKDLIPKDWSLV